MKETTNIHGTDEGNLTAVLPESLLIEMGIGWTRDPENPRKLTSACPRDYVAEIERLRAVLEKIAGRREYDPMDYHMASKYKPEAGAWSADEYLADSVLPPIPRLEEGRPMNGDLT